jgi:cell division topological specificity factor
MAGWIERFTGQKEKSAGQAKERLKLVLINDRTDLTPAALDEIKNELLEVISRHVSIDPSTIKINMTQDGREQRLVADIPIKSPNRKRYG